MMRDFTAALASGAIPAVIFALTLLEMAGLWSLHRASLSPLPLRRVLATILAGDFLLLAWLAAQHHAPSPVVAGCLLAALVAHAIDVAGRANRS